MSVKSRLLAVVTALALAGGMAAAGAFAGGNAAAATRSCGPRCIDVFSRASGTHRRPGLVLDVLSQRGKAGQPIAGFRGSRLDAGEDFIVSFRGTVSEFSAAGLVTKWLARRYPHSYAYEIEYAPRGVGSDLCVGTAVTAVNGTPVSLQRCGVSGRTIWVVGIANSTARSLFLGYAPLINGSETGFTRPYVLTCPRHPGPVCTLTTRTLGKPADGTQQWGANLGALR